jgi:hypothetical protein
MKKRLLKKRMKQALSLLRVEHPEVVEVILRDRQWKLNSNSKHSR